MIMFKETIFHLCVCVGMGGGECAFRPVIRPNESGLETHPETKVGVFGL